MLFRNHVISKRKLFIIFQKTDRNDTFRFAEHGFDDGFRDGERSGELEGRIFGCEKAFDLGKEIGFYSGCVDMWTQLAAQHPETVPQK